MRQSSLRKMDRVWAVKSFNARSHINVGRAGRGKNSNFKLKCVVMRWRALALWLSLRLFSVRGVLRRRRSALCCPLIRPNGPCAPHGLSSRVPWYSVRCRSPHRHPRPRFPMKTRQTAWASHRYSNTWKTFGPGARCPLCRWTTPPSSLSSFSSVWLSNYDPPVGVAAGCSSAPSPLSSHWMSRGPPPSLHPCFYLSRHKTVQWQPSSRQSTTRGSSVTIRLNVTLGKYKNL